MAVEQDFAIWEGVYQSWEDAPAVEGAFGSPKWLEDQAAAARSELERYRTSGGFIADNARSFDYVLPTVAAMASRAGKLLSILDFGGGMGSSYLSVRAALPAAQPLSFHVVESEAVCQKGREVFAGMTELTFVADLPISGDFDVIHAGRSFQYVDDWRGLLRAFSDLTSGYLILAGALAGDIPSFVSVQNYYGYKIRVRFLNLHELLRVAEGAGFRLISRSLHLSKRLGKVGQLPMNNFPEEQRLAFPCQLLFRHTAK